jgi:hypothetical protein
MTTETMTDVRTALAAWQPRIQRDARHRYTFDGQRISGVTTINGACGLGKEGLIWWAADEELTAAAGVARRLLTVGDASVSAALSDPRFICPKAKCGRVFAQPSTCPDCGKVALSAFEVAFRAAAGTERANKKQKREAGEIGTDVHTLIEWFLRRGMGETAPRPTVREEAEFVYAGFEEWAKGTSFTPLVLEFYVVHGIEPWYGGTVDLLALVDGRLAVVDWKSGKKGTIYPEHKLQNIGYRRAVSWMTGIPIEEIGGLLVSLPRDGGAITPHPVKDDPARLWTVFQGVHALHSWGGGN